MRVTLMPEFRCHADGAEVVLTESCRTLLTLLSLTGRRAARRSVEARLWPDADPRSAKRRLRQTLWRVRRLTGDRLLRVDADNIELADDVEVDYLRAESLARSILRDDFQVDRATAAPERWHPLGLELLMGQTRDEVSAARDDWNRLRILALEKLAGQLMYAGHDLGAIELAGLAIRVDELGEGPYRILAGAHLSRGDLPTARRVYMRYATLLRDNLGVAPSPGFRRLVHPVRT